MIPIFPFFYRYYRQEHGIDATRLSQMVEEDLENLGIPKVCNNKAIWMSFVRLGFVNPLHEGWAKVISE